MKSIFQSNSEEEAIVKFVKQNAELHDKTRTKFKDKQRKGGLWESFQEFVTVKKWFET